LFALPTPASQIRQYLVDRISCCSPEQFEDFQKGSAETTSELTGILADRRDEQHWSKAILALGYIGKYDHSLTEQLSGFLTNTTSFDSKPLGEAGSAVISDASANAKLQVPLALASIADRMRADGYNQESRKHLVDVLESGTDPHYWSGKVKWASAPHFRDDQDRDIHIAAQHILALGSVQGERVRQFICRLKLDPKVESEPTLAEAVKSACSQISCR
jgi:hypothetical protein